MKHAVNVASVDPSTLNAMRGHLDVTYRLGLLLSQFHTGSASAGKLEYRGEVAQQDARLLTAAFCAGLLEQALDEPVNIVNAEMLLRDRGIKMTVESQAEMDAFSSAITAAVQFDGESVTAGGTLFGTDMPRLFRLDAYRLEAYLDGIMLIFTHDDVPGIIGTVGTIFGEHNVNIAQMSVGREGNDPGGKAIGVLNLDALPPADAVEAILQVPGIHSARVIELPAFGHLPPWLQA